MGLVEQLLLFLILGAGFYMAWNIGANDVANAMGTSVGSGALSLRKAIYLAALFEFCGAFFFGSHVSETVQNKIIDTSLFIENPDTLLYGMLASLLATGACLQLASLYGFPISTTHSIIGAIIGFGLVAKGSDAIYWKTSGEIVASWLLSPLLGGVLSFILFSTLRKRVLFSQNPARAARVLTPWLVFFLILVVSLTLIYHGLQHIHMDLSPWEAVFLSLALSLFGFVVSFFCLSPRETAKKDKEEIEPIVAYGKVEKQFASLQVITACLMAFSHGANDVANAVGPIAMCLRILFEKSVVSSGVSSGIPSWLLIFGGLGIVLGLATWGFRVIETVGKRLTELTPSRGFAAEFGAAATILFATRLGLPISTTHVLVGSVIGVGLARGIEAIDLSMTRDIFLSWLMTVPLAAFLSTLFFFVIRAIF